MTDDDLLDWSMGQLDDPRREQVEAELAGSVALRERADAVHRTLAILDKFKVDDPPADLAQRVCRQVAAAREAPARGRRRPSIFSFAEIGAAAAALLLLALVFVPGVVKARAMRLRVGCESNMKELGVALDHYANRNNERLPFPDLPDDGNWLNRDGGRHATGTAPLFILLKDGIQPVDVICPAGKDRPYTGELAGLADFPEAANCSYSFQNMFGRKEPMIRDKARPVPILADRNPLFRTGAFCRDASGNGNSFNHGREGQNILFTDGRVRWQETPVVDGDNIWLAGETRDYKGTELTAGPDDWFFAP